MDEKKQDEMLSENENIQQTEELSEEELKLKEEMEALARTFQEELDKAKAEEEQIAIEKAEKAEEEGMLIQELESDFYDEDENPEDIPEEELCECCGERRRGTRENPDSPYCRSCEKALRHYPFEFFSVLMALIVIGFCFFACYHFSDRAKIYANSLQAIRFENKGKQTSAYGAYIETINLMTANKINGELVYKRAVCSMFNYGDIDKVTEYEGQFKKWEIKLPHLRKAYNVFKTYEEMMATQDKIYSVITEVAGDDITDVKDLPYDAVIAELDKLDNTAIELPEIADAEDGEEIVTSAYRDSVKTYNSSMLNFYRFYLAAACEKDYETQIQYLERIKEETPQYTWFYDSMLGDLYIKTGKDIDEYCDFLLKYNSENSAAYIVKATSLRVQGEYDEAIELAQKYIDKEDQYNYEFLRQQALCYLMKGEYKKAYDAANSSYQIYGGTLQSVDTLALCSLASGNTSTFEELAQLVEENGMQFSDEVLGYQNGTLTLEEILTKGDFDVL